MLDVLINKDKQTQISRFGCLIATIMELTQAGGVACGKGLERSCRYEAQAAAAEGGVHDLSTSERRPARYSFHTGSYCAYCCRYLRSVFLSAPVISAKTEPFRTNLNVGCA